ncbi:hypothetical protein P4S73_25020 [Paraglaciecola sp. Hal342]
MRHGVAINTRGVVDNDKFDRSLVPAGTRFTFEIGYGQSNQKLNNGILC